MEFEFDPNKSAGNKEKHGLDFTQAQTVWLDDNAINITSRETPERRFMAIGRIGVVFWSVVWTERDGRHRIISARRSRKNEEILYENASV